MKKILHPKFLLCLIVLIAAFLRFYQLNSNPPGLNWDEAAWGYNAYSLGIDGRDEFGRFLPWKFIESYGDYKPPVYAYLDIIPVKLFDLNAFSVRLPSALLGVLTVLLTYFLIKEIFYKTRGDPKTELIALLGALFLAVSPWHVMLSRGAFEANVSTFFIVMGVWTFLRSINKNAWLLVLSSASFALSFYTFNTARILVPLVVLVMAFMFRKFLLTHVKQTLVAIVIGLILVVPLVPFLVSPQAKLRFQEVNIFSDPEIVKTSNKEALTGNGTIVEKAFANRRILFGSEFLKHYADNLNPRFLFIQGDGNPRFSTQDVGELYLIDLPFLLLGLYFLFKNKDGYWWLIPVWFLLGIIPAATARETPHALRIETVIPTLQILVAIGLVEFIFMFKKHRQMAMGAFLALLGVSTFYFYHGYTAHYAREYSSEWQYPYMATVAYVKSQQNNFKSIEMTEELGRPYIYFLLYTKYNPKSFRANAKIDREALGFVHVRSFDKYKFLKNVDSPNLEPGVMYINLANHLPGGTKKLKTFYNLDGSPALVAYEAN